ncbi:hypothetical protein KP509_36G060700 [Ceratopteris richardii]|uniref:Uncharacterized protein n=1 Tax=Ceratopteris richardii TaxID=49495 RepID=A0A8T2QC62_CERRI|nr:hypothetical protein KP509_36G060700 [Ceratopteris richardii]
MTNGVSSMADCKRIDRKEAKGSVGSLFTLTAGISLHIITADMAHGIPSRFSICKDMGNKELACPRPVNRYNTIVIGDVHFCMPQKKLISSSSLPPEGEPGREILDILMDEPRPGSCGNPTVFTPLLVGSPPVRAGNPLIHDVYFKQNKNIPALYCLPQNCTLRSGGRSVYNNSSPRGTTCGSKPFVRIEGFACPSPDAQGVPAFA